MLPKVATTILHSGSRAVAVHTQSHTLRNVLGFQSQSSPTGSAKNGTGSSSSGRGNGPSSNGPKYHTGSRFQRGYHGAARVATQANTTAQDSSVQSDETEESPQKAASSVEPSRARRLRSSSVSLPPPAVFRAVQSHARAHHAFARTHDGSSSKAASTPSPLVAADAIPPPPALPSVPSSHRSFSSPALSEFSELSETSPELLSRSPPSQSAPSISDVQSPVPKSTTTSSPALDEDGAEKPANTRNYQYLRDAYNTRKWEVIHEAVQNFRRATKQDGSALLPEFNLAIEALIIARKPGDSIALIMETYNDLLSRGLYPNFRTYIALLRVLTARDHEVTLALMDIERQRRTFKSFGIFSNSVEELTRQHEAFTAETNYHSSLAIFKALSTMGLARHVPFRTLNDLLHSCATHRDLHGALLVWKEIEYGLATSKAEIRGPTASMYKHLITVMGFAGKDALESLKETINDFRSRMRKGELAWGAWDATEGAQDFAFVKGRQGSQLLVFNAMIMAYFRLGHPELAVEILDEMMNYSMTSTATSKIAPGSTVPIAAFNPATPPPPASSTFSAILTGFLSLGDVSSALTWFNKLLEQEHPPTVAFIPTVAPTRPDATSWCVMIENLVEGGHIQELFTLLKAYEAKNIQAVDAVGFPKHFKYAIFTALLKKVAELHTTLTSDAAADAKTLATIKEYLGVAAGYMNNGDQTLASNSYKQLWDTYIYFGWLDEAFATLDQYIGRVSSRDDVNVKSLRAAFVDFADQLQMANPSFSHQLRLAHYHTRFSVLPRPGHEATVLATYAELKAQGSLDTSTLSGMDWSTLLFRAVHVSTAAEPPVSVFELLNDIPQSVASQVALQVMGEEQAAVIINFALGTNGEEQVAAVLAKFGEASVYQKVFDQIMERNRAASSSDSEMENGSTPGTSPEIHHQELIKPTPILRVSKVLSRQMGDILFRTVATKAPSSQALKQCLTMFKGGLAQNQFPAPQIIAQLCQGLGRAKLPVAAKEVYRDAQPLLQQMADDPVAQSNAWFALEDSMVIALVQAGDIDGAHIHRKRMLEQGGAPSADSYGGLILHVRDTTDDASNALELWHESQTHGVIPNLYLYNNIISKLSKARRADEALHLFHEMREKRVYPSSITYGALIGALARVGDVESAEVLFKEMTEQKSYRPRPPPYNTMMQLYTVTKPNREKALQYYNQMITDGVLPTEYTYKLLMEAYVIEPVDVAALEEVFQAIVNNPNIELQGTHFATLINAYGCVCKDLDKAIATFDSIPTYPNGPAIEALTVEALINVFVHHRRTDLIPTYVAKMTNAGVHMTAYVANAMIRGYAVVGDMEQARAIFESLQDPPTGVAAPHNHAPHDPSSAPLVNPMEPVYREPSTWETMVRAELGSGNRDRATVLLERLQARHYPAAVYNRISGIMIDHSTVLG